MSRAVLIAANTDQLTDTFASAALSAGFTTLVAGAAESNASLAASGTDAPVHARQQATIIPWNRRSPLSARALLVQAANTVSPITDVIYLHSVQTTRTPFHEIGAAVIERAVDTDAKGRLFFLREALAYLQRARSGSLTLLLNGTAEDETLPLDAESAGAFVAFGRALFRLYQNEPIDLRGFQNPGAAEQEFAAFVMQQLSAERAARRGRWQKYSSRSGLFSLGRG